MNIFFKTLLKKKHYFSLLSLVNFLLLLLNTNFIQADSLKNNKNFLQNKKINNEHLKDKDDFLLSTITWEKVNNLNNQNNQNNLNWELIKPEDSFQKQKSNNALEASNKFGKINSFNRSIVIDNKVIGPDISWIVPPGFKWNTKYKFDFSGRGHNTKIPTPKHTKFFAWNDGDGVGLASYQFMHSKNSSFGLNLGIRSMCQGDNALGGGSTIGEGLSSGFRWDYSLSKTSGVAIGAEQLVHFDALTDTGRNIYITASKGWWRFKNQEEVDFPLYVATAGFATGRMAVGTIKGLCTDLFGGSGTETNNQRPLCWAPVFSLASVWNDKISTFFEYNSRFFLMGGSIAPIKKLPVRGTLAIILSDHVDNYKFHGTDEVNWVFNISVGL